MIRSGLCRDPARLTGIVLFRFMNFTGASAGCCNNHPT